MIASEPWAAERLATECEQCGAPLARRGRKGAPRCRVCATRSAQNFLANALTNRRGRGMPASPAET
jgi:hypothetical protein